MIPIVTKELYNLVKGYDYIFVKNKRGIILFQCYDLKISLRFYPDDVDIEEMIVSTYRSRGNPEWADRLVDEHGKKSISMTKKLIKSTTDKIERLIYEDLLKEVKAKAEFRLK